MLKTDRLEQMAARNQFPFAKRTLLINQLDSYREVEKLAQRAVDRGWLTDYVIVEEHADAALESLGLSRAILGRGYVYSIAPLVGVSLCRSEFLLYFMGDCIPEKPCAWLPPALELLQRDRRIVVANLTWDANYAEAERESTSTTDDFFLGPGFSDQCYLVRTADLQQPIYGFTHEASARFPLYAGESFEKRVDSWMQTHGYLRATYRHGAYLHQNVPPPLSVRLRRSLGGFLRAVRLR